MVKHNHNVSMFVYVSIDNGKEEVVKTRQRVVVFTGSHSDCINYLKMQYVDASIKMIDAIDEVNVEQRLGDEEFHLTISSWNNKLKTNELYHATTYRIG